MKQQKQTTATITQLITSLIPSKTAIQNRRNPAAVIRKNLSKKILRPGFQEPVLLKWYIRVPTWLIILPVFFLLIGKANGEREPLCKYTSNPKAMCYCENCPKYNTCMTLCHENLNGKPEVIKLQGGYFPEMYIESNTSTSIERLTLSNCKIREIDRDFFELYTSLVRFAIFDNKINDRKAPLELNLMKNFALTKVELFNNALTKFPRIHSDTLEYLDLRYNKISSVAPGDLKSLKKLKTLDLDDNELTTIGFIESPGPKVHLLNNNFPCNDSTYCEFEQYRVRITADYGVYCKSEDGVLTRFADESGLLPGFHCQKPKIDCKYSSKPKAMCHCKNCPKYNTCMKLCHENLNGKPEEIILQNGYFPEIHIKSNTPASMERLTLSNCDIREIDREFFELYTSLVGFAVFDNELNDSKVPLELNLTKNLALTKVELFSNALTKFPRIHSDTLKYLDLRYNKISRVTPGDLASLKKLKTLFLNDNQLTTIGFIAPPGLHVYLKNNNFPCENSTYCEFEQNRDYYCKNEDGALTRFANESGLLPGFQCQRSRKPQIFFLAPNVPGPRKTIEPTVKPSSGQFRIIPTAILKMYSLYYWNFLLLSFFF